MKDGFVKIACSAPSLKVADCEYNVSQMLEAVKEANAKGVKVLCFPELSVTGYTCGDLFLQDALIGEAERQLIRLVRGSARYEMIVIAGFPFVQNNRLFNCAAVMYHGEILGIVPKTNIPNYGEFYEARHFSAGYPTGYCVNIGNYTAVAFGIDQIFTCETMPDFCFGVEICEDLWVADTPSVKLAQNGAVMIFNLSASDEVIGKKEYRRTLVKAKSGSLLCAYAYANAGIGESTQDMVFSAHQLIAENGTILAESNLFEGGMIVSDIDVSRLNYERRRSSTWKSAEPDEEYYNPRFSMKLTETVFDRKFPKHPFVPSDKAILDERCEEILNMQAVGLLTRLKHIHGKKAVVGLSGGLDSTLALIVMTHAFDRLGLARSGIIAVTMPCFGTTDRTYTNACKLAKAYGVTLREIPIRDSVRQHFQDIKHDENQHDVTYENSQARERTQVLMDIANQVGGIVIGTGDLSELALGWATYNGDHMSMYGVNSSIPKTLVRYLTAYEASHSEGELQAVLLDILDTPVSPELLPPESDGTIAQKTEDVVGPYELHDFFLYYMVRMGFTPSKIYRLAVHAFGDDYTEETILKWEKKFYWRFFSQQFKRSCLPDSPKVGTVTLSPRGDWRMPSDACVNLWMQELNAIEKELNIRRRAEKKVDDAIQFTENVGNAVRDIADTVGNAVTDAVEGIFNATPEPEKLNRRLQERSQEIAEFFTSKLKKVIRNLNSSQESQPQTKDSTENVAENIAEVVGDAVSDAVENFVNCHQKIKEKIEKVSNETADEPKQTETVEDIVEAVGNAVSDAVEDIFNTTDDPHEFERRVEERSQEVAEFFASKFQQVMKSMTSENSADDSNVSETESEAGSETVEAVVSETVEEDCNTTDEPQENFGSAPIEEKETEIVENIAENIAGSIENVVSDAVERVDFLASRFQKVMNDVEEAVHNVDFKIVTPETEKPEDDTETNSDEGGE